MRQRTDLRRWRRPADVIAAALLTATVLSACLAPSAAAQDPAEQSPSSVEPSFEALLARGIAHSAGSDMRAGLTELRSAVRLEPGDELARRSLAIALLRNGRFGEAEEEFALALGKQRATALASGMLTAADLPDSFDADSLLGIATAVQLQGRARVREAERLHRTYAELMGPLSKEAGRAYYRLHELAAESGAEWLDADAEMAKAIAVDPDIRTALLLPAFANPRALPDLEPYLRPIELSSANADTGYEYDALPVLANWVAPADTSESLVALREGKLRLEILVSEDGRPVEVTPLAPVSDEELAPLVSAVGRWRFEPAVAEGTNAPAWILFGAEVEETEGESAGDGQPDPETSGGLTNEPGAAAAGGGLRSQTTDKDRSPTP